MNHEQILNLPSMPAAGPSYPHGPYRFIDREYFIVIYESDKEAIREAVPEPLEPAPEGVVYYEFIRMPDSSGFGDYTETGLVIPCTYEGQPCNFTSQMYLNDESPISGGREIWGHPAPDLGYLLLYVLEVLRCLLLRGWHPLPLYLR